MTSQLSDISRQNAWSKADIRRARQIPLKPVLEKLGLRLENSNNGNYIVRDLHREIIIKDHFWVCTENGSAGNSIDFLVKIQGMSFANAMHLLLS
jgi:thermostable 8-oxoguanine DNA glycosylase